MLEIAYNKRQIIYQEQLNIINGIKFTLREIDIIACVLHNRGEKKIASLLLISPRTVSTHVHNIMLKMGSSSKEHLIDFIEKSNKLLFIKEYYLQILIKSSFDNQLIKIGKTINKTGINCVINCKQINEKNKNIIDQLTEHLKLANINLVDIDKTSKETIDICWMLTNEPLVQKSFHKCILLLFDINNAYTEYNEASSINFSEEKNYYFSILELLKRIIGPSPLEEIITEFKKDCQTIENSWKWGTTQNKPSFFSSFFLFDKKLIYKNFTAAYLLCFILLIAYFIVPKIVNANKDSSLNEIWTDLSLPHENILLKHTSVLNRINEKLIGKDDIRTIVLVGIGGAGKTTIARQYARSQKIPLIWEINSETKESLISSFEQLAYSLCRTEEEKQELIVLPQKKDIHEKEQKLFLFLTKRIRNYPDWLLIYNNVETFQDIQKYFPYDPRVWGNGKVIITTRDSNIAHNSYILAENVIEVGILSKEEKFELFSKILNYNNDSLNKQKLEIINFLEKIPPFPLDVSIAAYYFKEEKTSYNDYLKRISKPEQGFVSIQETILRDIGGYNKTRYDIVTLSIKRIIEAQPDLQDLLLFVSMINPDCISKRLLEDFKDTSVVSKFIHELRKFSLINEKSATENFTSSTFSIHRSTQTVALAYLTKLLQLQQNTKQLQDISIILENAMDNELKNLQQPSMLVSHVEAFLNHNKLLNDITASKLKVKLGIYYFNTTNYKRAKNLLKDALVIYKEHYGPHHNEVASVATRLGSVYRNLGNYHKALTLFEEAYNIYEKNFGKKHLKTAWISTYLGSIYRNLGDYYKSQRLLENALKIYEKNYDPNDIRIARVKAYLGSCYKNIGNYKQARELLEWSFVIYKGYYGTDHAQTAWISARLGNLYRSLGEYDKARDHLNLSLDTYKKLYGKNCIETAWSLSHLASIYINLGDSLKAKDSLKESLAIYNEYLEPDHVTIGWALFHLGNAYQYLNEYDKSIKMLRQALIIYEKNYGVNHIQTAGVLNSLGEVSMLKRDLMVSEDFFKKALNVYVQNEHPERYIVLENLASLYLDKTKNELINRNSQESSNFNTLSVSYLKQALNIVMRYFPADSFHIKRLHGKLSKLN